MSGFPPAGRYTVAAVPVGADLQASLYAQGDTIWIGGVSITCDVQVPAYAIVGIPVTPAAAVDSTRSGNIDASQYAQPLEIRPGQAFTMLWVGAAGLNATMSITVVEGP